MGGRAHAIVEHALGRARAQIDDPFVEEPFAIRNAPRFKFAPQRLDPRIILMDDVDTRDIVHVNQIGTHAVSFRHIVRARYSDPALKSLPLPAAAPHADAKVKGDRARPIAEITPIS